MRRVLVIAVFLIAYSSCQAQKVLTAYYDSGWYLTINELAQYYRIGVIDTNDYHYEGTVKDFYISGSLQMRGSFVGGAKMDSFFFYYPNGKIKTQGEYWNNKRDGIWVNYYMNGNIQDRLEFGDSFVNALDCFDENGNSILKNGNGTWRTKYYNDNSGQVIYIEGYYKDSLRDSTWYYYTKDSLANREKRLYCTEKYKKGVFIEGTRYWGGGAIQKLTEPSFLILPESSKFKQTEKWDHSRYVSILDYPILKFLPKADSSYFSLDKLAEFPGGIDSLTKIFTQNAKFSKHYIYSQKLRTSEFEITIDENGKLRITQDPNKIAVTYFPDNQIFYDRIRNTIKKLPTWQSAVRGNKKVLNHFLLLVHMDCGVIGLELISRNQIHNP
jgi:antitoxin component YwqK of YwqJK toxin-antitoxin module